MLEGIFTRQERKALGFFLAIGLIGLLCMGWQRMVPPAPARYIELQVQVNVATAQELASLPGIGPALAKRVIADRQRHGRYLTLTDLKRVKGISPKTLAKLKGLVRFD